MELIPRLDMLRNVALLLLVVWICPIGPDHSLRVWAEDSVTVPKFSTDVMPVLSKAGCNLGTCHGNLNGKGGLKLSLRGQDPAFDFDALVRSARGRRTNASAPELSLFLRKATGNIAHGGGTRFDVDSPWYGLLRRWLRNGANGPSTEEPQLVRLDVQPAQAIVVDPQRELELHVEAHFSDGTSRDVTETACYELSNLNASVDANGVVKRMKFGETTLIVRYLQVQRPVPIAFIRSRPNFNWHDPIEFNSIDQHVFAKLKRLAH